ncbi:MAG: GNAT family N-acetyltransferase, partial [Acidobacteriota bacterium]
TIRVARHQGRPVASILTLRYKKTETYKYGCSEDADNNMGGMQLLLWQAIEEAKASGMKKMDLGRCDICDEGLAVFKERWGAERHEISYLRFPNRTNSERNLRLAHKIFSRLPDSILAISGEILYRHFA